MIRITLEINRKCNLRCNYCYITEKNDEEMSWKTAKNSVEFAINKIKDMNHTKRVIRIDFLGGEPLLSFDLIRRVVEYSRKRGEKEKVKFNYALTTNGTIFDKELLDFFVENKFSLKISLDGNPDINDMDRKTITGAGSYYLVEKNLQYIKEYERRTDKLVQVSSVLTHNNYKSYYSTLKFFVEQLGVKYIDLGFNSNEIWGESEIRKITKIFEEIILYFINCAGTPNEFVFGFLEDKIKGIDNIYRPYSCGAGILSFYISYSGNYFLCPASLKDEYCLGDVNAKHSETDFMKLIKKAYGMKRVQNKKCQLCKMEPYCTVKGCFINNLLENNSIIVPSNSLCTRKKLFGEIIKKYYFEIKDIKKKFAYIAI